MKIKGIMENLRDDLETGKMTIEEVALELHNSGWFAYVPDKEEVFKRLEIV